MSQRHLSAPGGLRDMAAVLMARLLTRPDSRTALKVFASWAKSQLQREDDRPEAVFLLPGLTPDILNQSHSRCSIRESISVYSR
jgi:hypothetical protein